MIDLKKTSLLLEERLEDILNSAKWFNLLNQLLAIIPFTSKEEFKKAENLKLHWSRYAILTILSLSFTCYTAAKLIDDSGFTIISMFIALALCGLAVIQHITLLNIFGALVTKYYKLLAEIDVLFIISNNNDISMNNKYVQSLLEVDTYLLIYIFITVPTRQAFIMEILNFDYLQNIALFVTAFINCYIKFIFILLYWRILRRFLNLNNRLVLF